MSLKQFEKDNGEIINYDSSLRIISSYRYRVRFTISEWKILSFLYVRRPKLVERSELEEIIFKNKKSKNLTAKTRLIDMHISAIRRKLAPLKVCRIDTIYGHGYRLLPNKNL